MIQPLLISTYDPKGGAGAAGAAYRLHQGLIQVGVDSKMLVQDRRIDDSTVMGAPNKVAQRMLSEFLINQLFGRCTICQHLRVDAITAKSAMATPNPAAIVLYSAIIKAGIYPAGFGSEKRKHGKISNSQFSLLANGSLTLQSPVRY